MTRRVSLSYAVAGQPTKTVKRADSLALTKLSKMFGGATIQKTDGGWLDNKGRLILEPSRTVYAYANGGYKQNAGQVKRLATDLAKLLHQQSVLLAVESVKTVEFVEVK